MITTLFATAVGATQTPFATISSSLPAQASISMNLRKTMWGTRAVSLAAKPNSSYFAIGLEDGKVIMVDAAGKAATKTFSGHAQPAYALGFSNDGKFLLTGDEQAKIFLWDTTKNAKLREFPRDRGHTRGISSLWFAKDDKSFISVGKDDAFAVWNITGGNPIKKVVGEPANFYDCYYSATGAFVTATQREGVRFYAPKTFTKAGAITVPGGQGALGFTMNPAGTLGVALGGDGNGYVIDLKTKARINTLKGHTDYVTSGAFTQNGKYIATTSMDATMIVWEPKSGKVITRLTDRSYIGSPVVFTGDGNFMITTNSSDVVEIYTITPTQKK